MIYFLKYVLEYSFKPRVFLQVEKVLEEKLPNSGLKASPHIESCMKTLKKQFNAIMDMLTHGSGFSWDNAKKMVLCDQDVFEGWVKVNIFTILPILYFYSAHILLIYLIHWYILLLSIYYVFYMNYILMHDILSF